MRDQILDGKSHEIDYGALRDANYLTARNKVEDRL